MRAHQHWIIPIIVRDVSWRFENHHSQAPHSHQPEDVIKGPVENLPGSRWLKYLIFLEPEVIPKAYVVRHTQDEEAVCI